MALTIMTVCDSGTDNSGIAEYPYQFYAKDPSKAVHVVNIIMPLGGKETGLYRFPKPGERVVVDTDGANSSTYYLIGYLPDVDNETYNLLSNTRDSKTKSLFETEKEALRDAEAMVLRYEQTGKETPEDNKDERYSELGFYRKETLWHTTDTNYRSVPRARDTGETESAYSAWLVKAGFPKESDETDAAHIKRISETPVFPKIDWVNIQSAGDMWAAAKNYQLLKAKRFELLVNCTDTTIHTKAELEKEELPLGDNIGDDPVLHAGDAHIRAGNRVVIKAGKEIILQVGKSVVKISDDGIELKSKLVNSNLTNVYDATFNMSGGDGISMFGRGVEINAQKSFGLGDAYGGSIGGDLGVVSIGGREIKAEVYDSVQYAFLVAYAIGQYAQSVSSGSMGINGNVTHSQVGDYTKFAVDTLKDGAELIRNIVDVGNSWYKKWKEYKKAQRDPLDVRAEEEKKKAETEAEEAKKEAEAEAEKKKKEADDAAEKRKKEAQDNADKEKRQADLDEAAGKIEPKEAQDKRDKAEKTRKTEEIDADLERDEKKADIDYEKEEKKADADLEKEKKIAKIDSNEEKRKAEEKEKKAKQTADEQEAQKNKQAEDDLITKSKNAKTQKEKETNAKDCDKKKEDAKKGAEADRTAAQDTGNKERTAAETKETTKTDNAEKDAKTKKTNEEQKRDDAKKALQKDASDKKSKIP